MIDTHFIPLYDRHNDLALARAITRNMARELLNIRHKLGRLGLRCGAADTTPRTVLSATTCLVLDSWLTQKQSFDMLLGREMDRGGVAAG